MLLRSSIVQATLGNQPLILPDGYNVQPAIELGGNHWLRSTSVPMNPTNNFAVFAVVQFEAYTAGYMEVVGVGSGNGYTLLALQSGQQVNIQLVYGGVVVLTTDLAYTFRQPVAILFGRSAGTTYLYRNGHAATVTNSTATPNAPTSSVSVGYTGSNTWARALVYEVGGYDVDKLSAAGTIMADLCAPYGIAVG